MKSAEKFFNESATIVRVGTKRFNVCYTQKEWLIVLKKEVKSRRNRLD